MNSESEKEKAEDLEKFLPPSDIRNEKSSLNFDEIKGNSFSTDIYENNENYYLHEDVVLNIRNIPTYNKSSECLGKKRFKNKFSKKLTNYGELFRGIGSFLSKNYPEHHFGTFKPENLKYIKLSQLKKKKVLDIYLILFKKEVGGKIGNIELPIKKLIEKGKIDPKYKLITELFNMDIEELERRLIKDDLKLSKEENLNLNEFNEDSLALKIIINKLEDLNYSENDILSEKEISNLNNLKINSNLVKIENFGTDDINDSKLKNKANNLKIEDILNTHKDLISEICLTETKSKKGRLLSKEKKEGKIGKHDANRIDNLVTKTLRKGISSISDYITKETDNTVEIWKLNIPNENLKNKQKLKEFINKKIKNICLETTKKKFKENDMKQNQTNINTLYNNNEKVKTLLDKNLKEYLKYYLRKEKEEFRTIYDDFQGELNKETIDQIITSINNNIIN